MDYYQGVVYEYLRADRSVFINTECSIQLDDVRLSKKGESWWCDAVAIDLRGMPTGGTPTVFLCEISYAVGLAALVQRLKMWSDNWPKVRCALKRDCQIGADWEVRPWLFVPQKEIPGLRPKLELLKGADGKPVFRPRITTLESVQPWCYPSWNHQDCKTDKSQSEIPKEMWT